MSNEMYIIIASGGYCSDEWSEHCVVSTDFDKATKWVNDALADQEKRNADIKLWEEAYSKFVDGLEPTPHLNRELIPKWPAGISQGDITVEMRSERNQIKERNAEIDEINAAGYRKYGEATDEFSNAFFMSLGYSEDDLFIVGMSWDRDTTNTKYEIKKVEVL